MSSVLAIVSKKVFEHDFAAGVGDVVETTRYASSHKTFEHLADGGDLYLVTVAVGDQLLLVGVLRSPKHDRGGWIAEPNTVAIRDISPLVSKLKFVTGTGITAKPGALAMSLQTPRVLTDDDVALLEGATAKASTKKVAAPVVVEKKAKVEKPAATEKTMSAKLEKPAKAAVAAKLAPAKRTASESTGADPDLATVAADLAANRLGAALDALLRAWARHRSAEVADAIDALGAAIARSLPAITGNKNTIDAAWRDVGDELRSVDVPRLAAALDLGTAPQAEGWLDILLRFPIDPRLAAPAIDMSLKFVSSTAGPTRTRAFKLAELVADGRSLVQIKQLRDKRRDVWNAKELRERLDKLAAKIAAPPALPKADAATLEAITAAIDKVASKPPVAELATTKVKGDADPLLAAVLADPHDEATRSVYTDYLLEHGDPRGELITLQSLPTRDRDQEARMRKLAKDPKNLKAWLGPLAAVVEMPVFRRGFLAECTVKFKSAKHRELLTHPLWATVEDVWTDELDLVRSPAMRSLQTVRNLSLAHLAELANQKQPVAFQTLIGGAIETLAIDKLAWEKVLSSPAFAKLRSLGPIPIRWYELHQAGDAPKNWTWLLDTPTGKQLTSLRLFVDRTEPKLEPWLAVMNERDHLERLQLVHFQRKTRQEDGESRRSVAFVRDRAGAPVSRIECHETDYVNEQTFHERLFANITSIPELAIVIWGTPKKAALDRITELANNVFGKQFSRLTVC